ncbi:unnamed protein product [Cochlearia groenlandica]
MGYWRSKVVPTMKKLFERSPTKKANLVESSKDLTFDDSKEIINKEIEEKKTELEPKVVEIYQATSAELKALVKEPTEDGLKKLSAEVNSFLEALVKIEFPGSKAVSETPSKSLGPVTFIFEKVCVFLPAEAKPREVVAAVEEAVKTDEPIKVEETKPEKEIEIVEEKKEEVKPAPVPVLAAVEEKKPVVEDKAVPVEEKKAAVEEKKTVVEEKKPAVEEKKPVEEVKKEVAAVPVVEITTTKAPETPVVETPAKAPAPSVAEPKKA